MKKKMILLGICLALLLVIIIRNINIKSDDSKTVASLPQEAEMTEYKQGIPRAEVFRLVSYLYYSDEDRQNLSQAITFQDVKEDEWYAEYVEAVYCAGFENQADSANGKYYIRPLDQMNRYECNLLFKQIAESLEIDLDSIYRESGLNLEEGEAADVIERDEFLKLYETVVSRLNEKKALVHMDSLYILAISEDGSIITQKGNYYGGELFYMKEGIEEITQESVSDYVDCRMSVLVSGQRIVYFREVEDTKTEFTNVYLVHAMGNEMTAYINGVTKNFELQANLTSPIDQMVANITCKNKKVIGISVKPDQVSDKVLLANEEYIELEHYGKVEYDQNFKIYKVYGTLQMEQTNAILVGYSNTQFVLTDNKISAALITEPITATNIRVMIKTNGYKSLFHESVKVTCAKAFELYYGEEKKSYKAKKEVTIDLDSDYLESGRLKIVSKDGKTPIQLLSVERSQGNPLYRGTIELAVTKDGIVVINELPIEEYLYAVVPSEMPVSYGEEALKTQAVCARSYAYKQLLGNYYSQYGAHVDDSSSYQVYNNFAETEETIQAVKETYGQVIEYGGEVITAYYFSTSCGYTSSMADVWGGDTKDAYLIGSFQKVDRRKKTSETESEAEGDSKEAIEVLGSDGILPDFSDETVFRKFLMDNSEKMLESEFAWYRWKTTLKFEEITANLEEKLASRYKANPSLILTEKNVNGETTFVSEPIQSIGEVTGIEVKERKSSGIITELILRGTTNSILVRSEYNIRALLAPTATKVVRQDESVVKKLSLLPSAFFVFDTTKDGVKIIGGGYGHGVGMSQNGVKALTNLGYTYDEIVAYYYKGTELKNIYQ